MFCFLIYSVITINAYSSHQNLIIIAFSIWHYIFFVVVVVLFFVRFIYIRVNLVACVFVCVWECVAYYFCFSCCCCLFCVKIQFEMVCWCIRWTCENDGSTMEFWCCLLFVQNMYSTVYIFLIHFIFLLVFFCIRFENLLHTISNDRSIIWSCRMRYLCQLILKCIAKWFLQLNVSAFLHQYNILNRIRSLIAISGWFFWSFVCVAQIKYLYPYNISIYCSV